MPMELHLGQQVRRGDAQERARRERQRIGHRHVRAAQHAGPELDEKHRTDRHQQRERGIHPQHRRAAPAAGPEQRRHGQRVEGLVQQDDQERAESRQRRRGRALLRRLDAGRECHALEERVQAHAERRARPREAADRMPVRVLVVVAVVAVHRIVAGGFRRLVLVEVREALQEEHRKEAEGQRHHQRIEQAVGILRRTGPGLHARHECVRHHVEQCDAEHDARDETQAELHASVVEPDHERHEPPERGRDDDAGAIDDDGGRGIHGNPPSRAPRNGSRAAGGARYFGPESPISGARATHARPCGLCGPRLQSCVRPLGW